MLNSRLASTTQGPERDRVRCAPVAPDRPHHGCDIYFVRIDVTDRGIRTERRIKDPVVVEVPLKLHTLRWWTERRAQRHVNEVAALALLILHYGSQRNRRGSLSTRHSEAQDQQTQNGCSAEVQPYVIFHCISFLALCFERMHLGIHSDERLFRSSWIEQMLSSKRQKVPRLLLST